MKRTHLINTLLMVMLLALSAGRGSAAPLGTEFSYQGFLTVTGSPANGVHQMVFTLFRPGISAPGPSVTNNNVAVSAGVFTVSLDFGAGVFDGTAYELGIAVRPPGTTGQFAVLQPRQPLTATPNSQHARTVSTVPDTALSPNVALLNGTPVFSAGIRVTTLRVTDSTGGGFLRFGPTDDCSIGVIPAGPQGLLLRDPRGVRILNPSTGPTRLLFGPTDDCTLGIDPAFPGLVERDPTGFRLLGQNNQGCRLIFGPTMDCTVEIQPGGPSGLLLRDPSGIRLLSPNAQQPPTLRFGPTDDCSLGIDLVRTGLTLRDPRGLRMLSPSPTQAPMLRFGPTDDCSLGIDPVLTGLLLRDPRGIRVLSPDTNRPPTLRFGPTDDCSLGIDPQVTGLLLRDPRGIRILPPPALAGTPPNLPTLRFGPTDDCSLGIDPAFPGLIERDPTGFRLLGQNNQGCRLIFGPTMDCTVEIQPGGPSGLLLRDPSGIRLLSPDTNRPPTLRFGPTDDCSLGIDPAIRGLLLRDPNGVRIMNPASTQAANTLIFGPTDDCRISAAPGVAGGMRFSDPRGFTFGTQGTPPANVTVNGAVFATQFVPTSSRRFKNDVKPIEKALDKISKLQGVSFTWTDDKGGRGDIGFIAEEVGKVIPEVVSWEEDGQNARGVNYDHLVAVAIEGIKAQQTQITTLEREKAELKGSLDTMQAQLDRLTAQMEKMMTR